MASSDNKQFLGRGWRFPPTFDHAHGVTGVTGEVDMVSAEEDIRQSLMILFSTAPGERVMLPRYGCPLHLHVFDGMNQHTMTQLRGLISDAVLRYEPRIDLEDIVFDTGGALDGQLRIRLVYMVRQTNARSNMVFPFYFSEGTNVRRIEG